MAVRPVTVTTPTFLGAILNHNIAVDRSGNTANYKILYSTARLFNIKKIVTAFHHVNSTVMRIRGTFAKNKSEIIET